ncbi:efflux RND transporter periplasmic adaptor subunit [Mesorhizobium sp. UC22_110]|uniref:efflux RND transporter periplasmic adaptor subunit n=1 Tax=unclassified Mesorhizobium TaxID=325217 RepID=UPI00366BB09F
MITEHERKLAAALTPLSPFPDSGAARPGMSRRLVRLLGLSALAAAAAIAFLQPQIYRAIETGGPTAGQPHEAAGASTPVEKPAPSKAAPTKGPVSAPAGREISGSGYVVAPRITTVFSKYEGRIIGVAVQAGDLVAAGQILVTLDDAGARFALERTRAARATADLLLAAHTIDLDQARASLGRTETLAARDTASKQQLEEARRTVERAENAAAQARQDLATAELAIRVAEEPVRELTVRAPFAGTVTRLDAHVGDTVLARVDSVRENQSLLTISDQTTMVIDADVAETGMADLQRGLRGEAVLDGFPDRPFAIEVQRVAPVASIEKGTVSLRLALTDPPAGIRPNMAARIRLQLTDSKTGADSQ